MMPATDPADLSMISLDKEGMEGRPLQLEGNPVQDEYFASYEDVEIHRLMVSDKPRTIAYANAISKNKHLFNGKVVMDVGAGTGILSLFMAAAGAKQVYAVEASSMATVIGKVACDNGFGNVIKVFHARVEDISLPENEKVDVIVSEWMGFYLLHESMLNSVIKARDMFLSEDGTIFPSEARIYACPCSLQALFREQISFWNDVYNFNMSAVKQLALKSKMVKPEVCLVSKSDLLAEPTCIKTFHLKWVTEKDVQCFSETTFVGITKAGVYQGLCLWFECDFDGRDYDEDGKELGALVTLSTSPSSSPTHWKQTVVVLGYESDTPNQQVDFSCQDSDPNDHGSHVRQNNDSENDVQGAMALSQDNKNNDNQNGNQFYENINEQDNLNMKKNYEVDEDEVVGWCLIFSQSTDDDRHYTMTVEMLDPETEEHPIPCACPMPRCMIIVKMMERDEIGEEEDVIDCT